MFKIRTIYNKIPNEVKPLVGIVTFASILGFGTILNTSYKSSVKWTKKSQNNSVNLIRYNKNICDDDEEEFKN